MTTGVDYNKTLNLPKTSFPMRADLSKREPDFYKNFVKNKTYYKLLERNANKPLYVLHDGPPYANGKIHLGTALNKILKDFIIKHKNMSGFKAPFVPGWDTHGLPIELKVLKSANVDKKKLTAIELRQMCAEYANKYVNLQKEQFQSLGVMGEFEKPYLTFSKEFEAAQIEVFSEMVKNNQIYKDLKPVYFCCNCSTALAESEIEYFDDACCSIYVKFKINDDKGFFAKNGFDKNKIFFLIWTTTTWTIPANVAICLGPNFEYCLVEANEEFYIVARNLVESTMKSAGVANFKIVCSFSGKELEHCSATHPFIDRESAIILGNHVTLESGTGCVHTAPGHGIEDYEVCKKYNNIPIIVVVDEHGKLNDEAGQFCGLSLEEGNHAIIKLLQEKNALFAKIEISHSYPHCWRCKEPVLFRATEQWFCSVNVLKEQTINSIKNVKWMPSWGEIRIKNMVADRSDWCISRQRVWGVPIPAFYCKECGDYILDEKLIKNIAQIFREFGSNAWFEKSAEEFMQNYKCKKCGSSNFYKETDIMDVWFDSGCTHRAVLNHDRGLKWPADLYLEGADQYRGWFQSSLMTAIATKGEPPYKEVCTHGWVVDGQGRKMSKSLSNGVAPEKIVKEYGTEILRIWVASSDYHSDIRISNEILKQLTESYRKIRNTARFMLANISDFDPDYDSVELENLQEIDKFALFKLNNLQEKALKAYNDFNFFVIYHAVHNFCIVDMSNFYFDVVKDRLYCDSKNSLSRRAVQTTLFLILDLFVKIVAPIISFTAEEIWKLMPHKKNCDIESVFFNSMNERINLNLSETFLKKWSFAEKLRSAAQKVLEIEREKKNIGSSLESRIEIYCKTEEASSLINQFSTKELVNLFLVSGVEVKKEAAGVHKFENLGVELSVLKPYGKKCERCWNYDISVGCHSEFVSLCDRCVEVVKELK